MKLNKELEYVFRDVLLNIFYDVPRVMESGQVTVESAVRYEAVQFNWQRDKLIHNGTCVVLYKNRKLARLQRKPHRTIVLYPFYDKDRYVQGVFERMVDLYVRGVTMEVRDE